MNKSIRPSALTAVIGLLVWYLMAWVSVESSNLQNRTEDGPNYPGIIKEVADRRSQAEREWRRLLDAYRIPQTPPDLHPIIYTPRSLLGVEGGFKILSSKPEAENQEIGYREGARSFIDRWHDLIGADPSMLSLISDEIASNQRTLRYKQSNFIYSVAGNFGELILVMDNEGRIVQLGDTLIPMVELPLRPKIESLAAVSRLIGRTFSYTDSAGREQRIQVGGQGDAEARQVVVFPMERGDAIEVHLAWEVVVGKSPKWGVYSDAITGEELRVMPDFKP